MGLQLMEVGHQEAGGRVNIGFMMMELDTNM
jgi:hypothetical protein